MNKTWKLATTIAIPLIGGTIAGALANSSTKKQYEQLKTPNYSPPGWVFPVAWTTLYTTMGIAKHQFDQQPKSAELQKQANTIYTTQLGFNYIWSFLFFRWQLRGTALIDAGLLCASVAVNTGYFYKKSKRAGTLMLPYLGWTAYAFALNYATWSLNRKK